MLSSTSLRPSFVRPSSRRAWPSSMTPMATRSRSPKRCTDVGGLGSQGACRFEVTLREVAEHRCEEEVAALDALLTVALEQPLPASEPPTRRRPLASHQQIEADPPGAARGSRHLARVEVGVVSALEAANVLVVDGRACRPTSPAARDPPAPAGSLRPHARATRTRLPRRASRTTPGRARASSSPTPSRAASRPNPTPVSASFGASQISPAKESRR